jgi:hypothetical protein
MIGRLVTRFAAGLRFPTLFKIVAALFVVDFFVPDLVPFYDEILLALGTVLLGSLKARKGDMASRAPPVMPGDAG